MYQFVSKLTKSVVQPDIIIVSEFGISFAHASVIIRDKQAFSAAEVAREEYSFVA